jgi:glycosyltransferase involved in cell wall biosynthesis
VSSPNILIDGVIFQIQKQRPAGISRVWSALLKELAASHLASNLVLLDRGATAPRIPGLRVVSIHEYNQANFEGDAIYLQGVVDAEGGDLVISTYYTYPENSACMVMLHDMTPEMMGLDLNHPEWRAKTKAIEKAFSFLAVSESTKNDFRKLYPQFNHKPVYIVPNAISPGFVVDDMEDVRRFKMQYGIKKPYFFLCGHRMGYKNAILFFKAFALLENKADYEILCTGGHPELEQLFLPYVNGSRVQARFLPDKELPLAYRGAIALVYPSLYEGFGLPLLEAMSAGCPVITCKNSSLPEVAGEAALYVDGHDVLDMQQALVKIQNPELRDRLIRKGFENAKRFSWRKNGTRLIQVLDTLLRQLPAIPKNSSDPVATALALIYTLLKAPERRPLAKALNQSIQTLNSLGISFNFGKIAGEEEAIKSLLDLETFTLLENASRQAGCDGFIHYWHALGLEKKGSAEAAFGEYMRALKRGLNNVRVGSLAANHAYQLGKAITAANLYASLLEVNPQFQEARTRMKRLELEQARLKEEMKLTRILQPEPAVQKRKHGRWQTGLAVSVVLPSKDRPEGLEEILDSLPAAMQDLEYEVLLYLGGEQHPEVDALIEKHGIKRVFHDPDIFAPGEKFSWSKLMNHGFRNAGGEWVIYASDDIVFHPGAFERALRLAEGNPRLGGITFLHRNTVEDYGGVYKDFGYDSVGGKIFINFGVIRKEAFLKTAGFDERYKFYWADVDLCLQVWEAGYTLCDSPHSLVEHNNIVDKFRVENSGDRYFSDTKAYYDKWKDRQLLKGRNILAKERFYLDEAGRQEAPGRSSALSDTTRAQEPEISQPGANGSVSKQAAEKKGSEILVSAIVSTYNSARFLAGCLDDLEAQTIAEQLEIIVVDSGSEQREGQIVRRYQERYKNIVYIRTEERESVYAAWNRAVQAARGAYLTNANTDDRHRPDALEVLARALAERPEVGVAYADCAVTQVENTSLAQGPVAGRFRWPDFDRRTLFQNCIIGPQPMWRRSLHEQHGLFDPEYTSAGDYEFWLRLSDKTGFLHIPQILGLYLVSAGSIEHRDAGRSVQEAEQARERYWEPEEGPRPPAGGSTLEWYGPRSAQGNGHGSDDFPLVSVVVPTFNRPVELRAALESVFAQTYPNLEIIVINDAGPDVSRVVHSLGARRPVRYEVHSENLGAGAARNTGLRLARGKYVAFLDDDDAYHPGHLFALVAELEAEPASVAAYTDAIQITVDGSRKKARRMDKRVVYSVDYSPAELMVRNYIPILCLVFRRAALRQAGFFDPHLPALEDWEWLTRLAQAGPFRHLPFVTAEYVVRHGVKTRNMVSPEMIQALYIRIYSSLEPFTDEQTRAAQRRFYASMTGRELAQDAPGLFNPVLTAPTLRGDRASETLAMLLEADDLPAALEAHAGRLDNSLVALTRLNAEAARADGDEQLAEGLEDLAAYIAQVIGEPGQIPAARV